MGLKKMMDEFLEDLTDSIRCNTKAIATLNENLKGMHDEMMSMRRSLLNLNDLKISIKK